jgi:uncharacterized protein YcbX
MQYQVQIKELKTHPLKSAKAVQLSEANLTPTGIEFDRFVMLVGKTKSGEWEFISQRNFPKLALVNCSIINSPNNKPANIALNFNGASLIFDPYTPNGPNFKCSMHKSDTDPSGYEQIDVTSISPVASKLFLQSFGKIKGFEELSLVVRNKMFPRWKSKDNNIQSELSDAYPYTIQSVEDIQALNQELAEASLPNILPASLRANIVIEGLDKKLPPLELLKGGKLYFSDTEEDYIELIKPCARCPIPVFDQDTAKPYMKVNQFLAILKKLNLKYLNIDKDYMNEKANYVALGSEKTRKLKVGDIMKFIVN